MADGFVADRSVAGQLALAVEVCYAPPPPAAPIFLQVNVAAGTTLAQAVAQSGLAQQVPALAIPECRTGIWGKLRPPDTVVKHADRIELYRPLQADPKESRRRRAKEKPASAR